MLLDVLDLPFTFNPKRLASAPTLNKFSQWLASWFGIDVTGINNLSTAAMDDFNSRIQNHPNVKYMSYGGAKDFPWYSIWHLPSSWIRDYYDTHDQSIDADGICAGGANDGLVAINSANWGEYQGTTNLDHLEQIGLGVWNKVRNRSEGGASGGCAPPADLLCCCCLRRRFGAFSICRSTGRSSFVCTNSNRRSRLLRRRPGTRKSTTPRERARPRREREQISPRLQPRETRRIPRCRMNIKSAAGRLRMRLV